MKKTTGLVILLIGIALVSTGCGPNYRTQQGAVIGAALGAWAGQDIGHDPESTMIGAAVGGVAGAVIGDAVEQYETDNAPRYPYYQQPYQQAPPRRY